MVNCENKEPDEVVALVEVGETEVVVLVVLKVALRKSPKPTMRIMTITMRAETPRETTPFARCEFTVILIPQLTEEEVTQSTVVFVGPRYTDVKLERLRSYPFEVR